MKTLFRATLISLAAFAGAVAHADSTTMNVKIVITAACNISSTNATDVDFGSVASTMTDVLGTAGSLTANCTKNTPYRIALDNGANYGSGSRQMKTTALGGTDVVAYALYQDAGRNTDWGSTSTTDYPGVGNGANQIIPVYGKVPSANFPVGTYTDLVTATITY